MNIFKLLKTHNVEPEGLEHFISRRDAFAKLANFGKKTALAAIPLSWPAPYKLKLLRSQVLLLVLQTF